MTRRFRQHDLRQHWSLDGTWDFAFLGNVDCDELQLDSIVYDDRMAVPGCFDATPKYAGQRGLAAYRTNVLLADATPHRLVFDNVQNWCRVFLNGTQLAEHGGGFTQFSVDIPPGTTGEAELVVLVENNISTQRSPLHMHWFDWYHYGGIAGAVELHRLGELWIENLLVRTEDFRQRRISLVIDYRAIHALGNADLSITCEGRAVHEQKVSLDADAGRLELTLTLEGAKLWSPEQPNLHMLHVRLGDDDIRERIGIRQVLVKGRDILFNGEPLQLRGFCRHNLHPLFGDAIPDQVLVSDVQQLKDMNCNFVRGSHYPQDLRFLDLCDEVGLCVWNEATGWQNTPGQLTDENYIAAQMLNIDEMVAMSVNRPSVILWGVLNEFESHDPKAKPACEKFLNRLRELDPTRPVTYATFRLLEDVCYDLADVISLNRYPGWYEREIEDIPEELAKVPAHLDSIGQGHKPIIISEIGGGAIFGCRDWYNTRWSEDYQARLLETVIRSLFGAESNLEGRVCGLSIWQFCDVRSTHAAGPAMFRPRAYNNKGVVDEFRRPKLAYDVVKRLFAELA